MAAFFGDLHADLAQFAVRFDLQFPDDGVSDIVLPHQIGAPTRIVENVEHQTGRFYERLVSYQLIVSPHLDRHRVQGLLRGCEVDLGSDLFPCDVVICDGRPVGDFLDPGRRTGHPARTVLEAHQAGQTHRAFDRLNNSRLEVGIAAQQNQKNQNHQTESGAILIFRSCPGRGNSPRQEGQRYHDQDEQSPWELGKTHQAQGVPDKSGRGQHQEHNGQSDQQEEKCQSPHHSRGDMTPDEQC